MLREPSYDPTPYDDDWEDQPAQSPFHKWILGMLVPLAIAAWGARAVALREVWYGGVEDTMALRGTNALALGIAAIAAALFMHCHYFWGNIYDQAWFAVLGKILAACAFIAACAVVIVRVGIYGAG